MNKKFLRTLTVTVGITVGVGFVCHDFVYATGACPGHDISAKTGHQTYTTSKEALEICDLSRKTYTPPEGYNQYCYVTTVDQSTVKIVADQLWYWAICLHKIKK